MVYFDHLNVFNTNRISRLSQCSGGFINLGHSRGGGGVGGWQLGVGNVCSLLPEYTKLLICSQVSKHQVSIKFANMSLEVL